MKQFSKLLARGTWPLAFLLSSVATLSAAERTGPSVVQREIVRETHNVTPSGAVIHRIRHSADEVIVKFKDGAHPSVISTAHAKAKGTVAKKFSVVRNLHLVKLPRGASLQKAIQEYSRDPHVQYAEPNYIVHALVTPNDPSFESLWGLQNTGQNGGTPGADIDAARAWDLSTGSNSVVVAVIDTGIDYNHPDLAANIWTNAADCNSNGVDDDGNGYIDDCRGIDTINNDSDPMDDNNHGTHVAGTIGAVGNNAAGVVGVNWNVSIMPCKFLNANGEGTTAGAIGCLNYVRTMKDRGVNIVATNNSWGGGDFSQALFEAIDAHRQRGILFIAAAGNDASDNDTVPAYPASYDLPNIIAVAATDRFDNLAYFSNFGRRTVHLGAPGHEILSTTRGDTYSTFSGTSMAAPHVTGVAALLKARNPGLDWRAIKNLILAGGDDPNESLRGVYTVTGSRLNAFGALTCFNSTVLSRLEPTVNSMLGTVGTPILLSVLHINCANANGEVNVVVYSEPGDQIVTLRDDGVAPDQAAGDGIYSAYWSPPAGGDFYLKFPKVPGEIVLDDIVAVTVDSDLKPGFPVKTFHGPGTYHAGPAIHTLVGNIDDDPNLEIVVTGLATGPLYAWKADGSPVPGWAHSGISNPAYPAMGDLSNLFPGFEVASVYWGPEGLVAYNGGGSPLTGWPVSVGNTTPPALADVDGDGLDEIFVGGENRLFHAYRADGSPLPGWPSALVTFAGQERHTPAIADLDGDGDLEIVTASGATCDLVCIDVYLFAFHHDSTPVRGFPVLFNGYVDTFPAIGDVDGDGAPEIVVVGREGGPPWRPLVYIVSNGGAIKRVIEVTGTVFYGTAPALADLDGDGIPEIIVQTNEALNIFRGDGSTFPGWPVVWGSNYWLGSSAPVVGDVNGDQLPDIVVTSQFAGSSELGEVRVYNRDGVLHPRFPKTLPIGFGAVPAIADLDLDGRNEIIVSGSFWNGVTGYYDKVWVFDLGGPTPHGPIHWGQFMGGPKHQGAYVTPPPPIPPPTLASLFPNSAMAGSPGFPLTVEGTRFDATSVVRWNGAERATTFINSTQLLADVTAGDIANPGIAQVTVFNPPTIAQVKASDLPSASGVSNALPFTINAPVPTITSINPTEVAMGAPTFQLTVNGTNFVASSRLLVNNGGFLATTFVSPTQLIITIPAGFFEWPGTHQILVSNPPPGGGASNALLFTVNSLVPTITSINPIQVTSGGPAFTLTVNGTNFIPPLVGVQVVGGSSVGGSSVVQVNGSARATEYISPTQLTATILASDIASGGNLTITVFTPTPGGGTSNPAPLTVVAPLTLTTLTADKTAPQPVGTAIQVTANTIGGRPPLQFKWWETTDGVTWMVLQDWSPSSTVTWTPRTPGTSSRVGVWVKSATTQGDTYERSESTGSISFAITAPPPVTLTSLTTDKNPPQGIGTAIQVTANTTGGTGPLQYKWWATSDGANWSVIQGWSASNSVTWTPATAGTSSRVGVWIKGATNPAETYEASGSIPFAITGGSEPSPIQPPTLATDRSAPQPAGTAIQVTANTTGGTGPLQYKWWATSDGANWSVIQGWSASNSVTWTPATPGANSRVGVWIKSATNPAETYEASGSIPFAITNP